MKKIFLGFILTIQSVCTYAFDFQASYISCYSPSARVYVTITKTETGEIKGNYQGYRLHDIKCSSKKNSISCIQPNGEKMLLSKKNMKIQRRESIDRIEYELAYFFTNENISLWACIDNDEVSLPVGDL